MRIFVHEITEADLKDRLRGPLAKRIGFMGIRNMMGRILPNDVGKRVYKVSHDDGIGHVYQIENDAQRDARTG